MNDEMLFNEYASKLIDNDREHAKEYRNAYIDINAVGPFFSKFRVGLIVFTILINFIIINIENVAPWNADINYLLTVIWGVSVYFWLKRRLAKKEATRKINYLDSSRVEIIHELEKLVDKHSEWRTEKWWNTLSSKELWYDGEIRKEYEILVAPQMDGEENDSLRMVTEEEIKSIIDMPDVKYIKIDGIDRENLFLAPIYFFYRYDDKMREEEYKYFSLVYPYHSCERDEDVFRNFFYKIGSIVFNENKEIYLIIINYKQVKVTCETIWSRMLLIKDNPKRLINEYVMDEFPIEEILRRLINLVNDDYVIYMKYYQKRPDNLTIQEWARWLYGGF